ncbi:hypothetical protein JTB14_034514 [Gonioctena quinquepunctata]|nr:hypothetical protein JTB14_034514 [Gonioctena quinquepunctata]
MNYEHPGRTLHPLSIQRNNFLIFFNNEIRSRWRKGPFAPLQPEERTLRPASNLSPANFLWSTGATRDLKANRGDSKIEWALTLWKDNQPDLFLLKHDAKAQSATVLKCGAPD